MSHIYIYIVELRICVRPPPFCGLCATLILRFYLFFFGGGVVGSVTALVSLDGGLDASSRRRKSAYYSFSLFILSLHLCWLLLHILNPSLCRSYTHSLLRFSGVRELPLLFSLFIRLSLFALIVVPFLGQESFWSSRVFTSQLLLNFSLTGSFSDSGGLRTFAAVYTYCQFLHFSSASPRSSLRIRVSVAITDFVVRAT